MTEEQERLLMAMAYAMTSPWSDTAPRDRERIQQRVCELRMAKDAQEQKQVPAGLQRQVFTFGNDHVHPHSFASLKGCYVVVVAEDPRAAMLAVFGGKWSMQYPNEWSAGVYRHRLRRIQMPDPQSR